MRKVLSEPEGFNKSTIEKRKNEIDTIKKF